MDEPKVIVWHDDRVTQKWMVTVMGCSGRINSETPYHGESDAVAIASTIGRTCGCPVYRRNHGQDELIAHGSVG